MPARAYPLVLLAALGGCAPGTGEPFNHWDVRSIPATGAAVVDLPTPGMHNEVYVLSIQRAHVEQLKAITERMSAAAGIPAPRLYLSDRRRTPGYVRYDAQGGNAAIAVTTRLLYVLDGDEGALAAMIGHELGHIAMRHPSPFALDVTQVDVTSFSHRQELEADAFSIRLAHKSGYDPAGLERYFLKMNALAPKDAIFSETYHPSPQDRIAHARRLVNELRGK